MDFDYDSDLAHLTQIKTLKIIVAPVRKKDGPVFKTWVEGCPGVKMTFGYY